MDDRRRAAEALFVELKAFEIEEKADAIRIAHLRSEAQKYAPSHLVKIHDHLARRMVDRAIRRRALIEQLAHAHELVVDPDAEITAVRPRPSGTYAWVREEDDDDKGHEE